MQIETIERNRQKDYERFEAHVRFEEATDIAERIGYPIDHTVRYEMRNGFAYGEFDKKNRPFHELTDQARREGHMIFTGTSRFEAVRREHEHEEALLVDRFGRGELEGTVLVKSSPVPDAVRDGTTEIDGYRRDLLRSFVRIYYRTDEGVECRLFSLDKSDRRGMAAVGDLLGIDTVGRGSEDILSDHALVDIGRVSHEAISHLVQQTKSVYDHVLEAQTGKKFHAGSSMLDKNNALSLVMRQSALLDEHMQDISKIMGRVIESSTKKALLEQRRKRTAAAIDLVEHGGEISSSNDSSVTDQMSTKEYGGECVTGNATNANAVNAVGMAQGRKAEQLKRFISKKCPNETCGMKNVLTVIDGEVISGSCGCAKNICTGEWIRRNVASSKNSPKSFTSAEQISGRKHTSKEALIQARFGRYARIRTEINIGGTHTFVYDQRTGEVITKL